MTIRNFITNLHALAPTVEELLSSWQEYAMDGQELRVSNAQQELAHTWMLPFKGSLTSTLLDKIDPSPADFIQACQFEEYSIGTVSFSNSNYQTANASYTYGLGNSFYTIGGIHQDVLLFNTMTKGIYWTDYDSYADQLYKNFHLCAQDFSCFLDAFSIYCRLISANYRATDLTGLPLLPPTEEAMLAATMQATNVPVDQETNIWISLFGLS